MGIPFNEQLAASHADQQETGFKRCGAENHPLPVPFKA